MIKTFANVKPHISESAYVDPTAAIIGDVTIDEDSSIWPMVVARGDINKIIIGKRTNIQDGSIIHVTHASEFNPEGYHTKIGDNVIVGHRVILHGCTIDDHVLVGMGSIIMDGVYIHPQVLIGAGSVVPPNKILNSGVWVGSPARRLRALSEQELNFLLYSADYYVKLKDEYKT